MLFYILFVSLVSGSHESERRTVERAEPPCTLGASAGCHICNDPDANLKCNGCDRSYCSNRCKKADRKHRKSTEHQQEVVRRESGEGGTSTSGADASGAGARKDDTVVLARNTIRLEESSAGSGKEVSGPATPKSQEENTVTIGPDVDSTKAECSQREDTKVSGAGAAGGGADHKNKTQKQQQMSMNPRCYAPNCSREGTRWCAKCKSASYCGRECQKAHWKVHTPDCRRIQKWLSSDATKATPTHTASHGAGAGAGVGGKEEAQEQATEPCAICLENEPHATFKMPTCDHTFHRACITQWMSTPTGQQTGCPLCRQSGGVRALLTTLNIQRLECHSSTGEAPSVSALQQELARVRRLIAYEVLVQQPHPIETARAAGMRLQTLGTDEVEERGCRRAMELLFLMLRWMKEAAPSGRHDVSVTPTELREAINILYVDAQTKDTLDSESDKQTILRYIRLLCFMFRSEQLAAPSASELLAQSSAEGLQQLAEIASDASSQEEFGLRTFQTFVEMVKSLHTRHK